MAKPQSKTGRIPSDNGNLWAILAMLLAGATAPRSDLILEPLGAGDQRARGRFRYHARPEKPLYMAGAEYLARNDKAVPFQKSVSFSGEFAIDPESGAVLRLTMIADLEPRLPVDQSKILVEYGPVLIGGNTYICRSEVSPFQGSGESSISMNGAKT